MDNTSNPNPDTPAESENLKGKILHFPKRASKRLWLKYSLSISLATAFLLALFVNQVQFALIQKQIHTLAGEKALDLNRIPANVKPEDVQAILQEQKLAKAIDAEDIKVIGAQKVQSIDQFVYGTLQGKYRAQIENGKILQLQLSPHVSPMEGQVIPNKEAFLWEHRNLFAKNFSKVILLEKGSGFETFDLQDQKGSSLAKIRFLLDNDGHISMMELTH